MAIRWHVPGFSKNKTDARPGGNQVFWDEKKNYLTVDGYYYHGGLSRMIADLKLIGGANKGATNRLLITHWHIDHYGGIWKLINHKTSGAYTFNIETLYCPDPDEDAKGLRDNAGSRAVKSDLEQGRKLIRDAKARGIKVVYLKNEQTYTFGDLTFQAFRDRPDHVEDSDTHGWAYLNSGSFFLWFDEIKYLCLGDGPAKVGEICEKYGLDPILVNGDHHGNCMPRTQAKIMWRLGCRYYWDNDLSKGITPFLETGREDAIGVGMKFISIIGDINGFTKNGYFYVLHDGKIAAKYKCSAKPVTFKNATASVVRKLIRGSYGTGDRSITYLLKLGYSPMGVINKAAQIKKTAQDIKSGKADYGKNEERIRNLDAKFGDGFGQLVQDYINVLYGVREKV